MLSSKISFSSRAFRRATRLLVLVLLLHASVAEAQSTGSSRITARLDYRRGPGAERCPTEHSIKAILNRFFEYEAIQPTAGPVLGVAVSGSTQDGWFETVLSVSDADGKILWNSIGRTKIKDCFALMINEMMLLRFIASDNLQTRSTPEAEKSSEPPPEPEPLPPELPPPPAAEAGAGSAASAPPPAATQLPPPPVLPPAEGVRLGMGMTFSAGLTPSPSFGGIATISTRWGDWSGALEARLDHSIVPARLDNLRIESLFAGATLVLPCAHLNAFSGCLVTDAGGFVFNGPNEIPLDGSRAVLAIGLRANLERPIAEHLVIRGFAQISAVPVSGSLVLNEREVWRSLPAFGTIGLTLTATP